MHEHVKIMFRKLMVIFSVRTNDIVLFDTLLVLR
jgi:hypothetical protein